MNLSFSSDKEFVKKLSEIVLANLDDENFGVEQLIEQSGLSSSIIRQRLKKISKKTIAQFINEVRLKQALAMLQDGAATASEVAYKVGFSSPTYFNSCFHDYFGYTPGEAKKRAIETNNEENNAISEPENLLSDIKPSGQPKLVSFRTIFYAAVAVVAVVILVFAYLYLNGKFLILENESLVEKSIAVRPFNYLGANPEKEYLATAMMLEIINQLSQIKDLRVMSSSSVLPYSNQTDKAIGKKINCSYILNGNLHIENDEMNLILNLVNTEDESVVKAFNYKTVLDDIIELPGIIAHSVAKELQVELSKKEKDRIEKIPTLNLTAYDFFQRGREEHYKYWSDANNLEALELAKDYYNKALEYDSTFARAYTGLAMVYWNKNYWFDYLEDNFLDSVKILVNKAFSFDPESPEAFVMNGEYLRINGFFEEAEREYDKALALNPNEWLAYLGKANLYAYVDDLERIKNLHHVLSLNRGIILPTIFENLYYAYLNAGFIQQAVHFASGKVKLDGDSVQYLLLIGKSEYEKHNYVNALDYSLKAYKMDSSHVELLHLIGWYYDCLEQYDKSILYYQRLADILDIQNYFFGTQFNNLHRMGYSFYMNGDSVMADFYFDLQVKVCSTAIVGTRNYSDYLHYDLAGVQAFRGKKKEAYKNLKKVAQIERFQNWFAVLVQIDPLFDSLRGEEEFENFVQEVQLNFSKEHERVKKWLEEQNLRHPED